MSKQYIEVVVSKAKKANEALRDEMRGQYETMGSNNFIFKNERDLISALYTLKSHGLTSDDIQDCSFEDFEDEMDESTTNTKTFKQFIVENIQEDSNTPELKGKIKDMERATELIAQFDWYAHVIDSLSQQKKVEAKNKDILDELKKLGVTEIDYPGYSFFGTNGRKIKL